jgi:hypothetical protein
MAIAEASRFQYLCARSRKGFTQHQLFATLAMQRFF